MSESAKNYSTPSANNDPQPAEATSPEDKVKSAAPGSPAEFQAMAHDVNPVSGASQTSSDEIVHQALQQSEPKSSAPQTPSALVSTTSEPAPKNFFKILVGPFKNYPQQLLRVIAEYKLPVATFFVVLVLTPFILAAVALLAVLNTIPLMAPTLKLVGLGYTTWFVYRHLLRSTDRQALLKQIQAFKAQLIGNVLPEAKQD